MPDNLDQINVTTRRYIRSKPSLVDGVYNQDALNYFMRENLREDFAGGSKIAENFIYNPMIGGAYLKGKRFNTNQRQTEQQCQFDIKFTQVSVPLYQEDFLVLNKGALAAVNLLKSRIDQAYMSLGEFVSIAAYLPTNATYSIGGNNYSMFANPTGLAEHLNDGVNPSWDGNTYPTEGGLTRTSYNGALVSTPVNLGGGSIEYDTIDINYMNVFYGSGNYEPNLMMTTPTGFSYIKSKFQTQQRFPDKDLNLGVGFRGMAFNGATVVASRLCPGSYITGQTSQGQDPVAQTYLSETLSSNASGPGSQVTYPVGNLAPGGKPAESLWILNARKPFLNYYVSDDEMFGGGFRDFIPEGGSTTVVAQVLLAHQITLFPRYHKQIYGFTS